MTVLAASVSAGAWLAVGYMVLMSPLTVIWLRQLWSDHEHWRAPSRRGFARTAPSAVLFVTIGVLFVPSVAVADVDNAPTIVLLLVLLVAEVIALLLVATTYLLVRPKLLVPPPRRDDPSPLGSALRGLRPRSRR